APSLAFVASALALAFTPQPTYLDPDFHMETVAGMNACCGETGVRYGKALAAVLPKDVIIATTMAGGMPYYAGVTTIDQYGLTDATIARQPPPERGYRRGHIKLAPIDYLRSRQVNIVIGHPTLSP